MKIQKRILYFLLFITLVIADCLLFATLYDTGSRYDEENTDAIQKDIVYFPVPESSYDKERYSVTYVDSFLQSRSYGGDRVHEGTDIMAGDNLRGHYPVISISDGVVEQKGWLKLGGYRIGIRSPNGVYFYYAHLSDYADDLEVGDSVKAGELLGFMGDTGYSEIEGTTGNFPVHLHLGIYLNTSSGEEKSYNPYPYLLELEDNKLTFCYE
ncbi:MAG: M23 family metallopeptidase [Lachnospiraceae bacterium]|nr:M23 family metallopeptidase [Lachnospiraceae bacterium]